MVLDCFSCLEDEELTKEERILGAVCIFYEDIECVEDLEKFDDCIEDIVKQMFWFFNCGDDNMEKAGKSHVLVDWDKDSQLICSAVNKVAGKEIRVEPFIHWWTFMGYYMGIGESLFSTVLSIRHKIVNGEKLEKHESKFRRENPQYFNWNSKTIDQKEADNWLQSVWNSDK